MLYSIVKILQVLSQLKKQQYWALERLRSQQFSDLQNTIRLASANVPYYQRLFKINHLTAADIRTWDDLEKIPFTTKNNIRTLAPEDLMPVSVNLQGLYVTSTTGSSGVVLRVSRNLESSIWEKAFFHYTCQVVGVKFYERICHIRTIPENLTQSVGLLKRIGFKRYFHVSLKQKNEDLLKAIMIMRPQVLYTYPSVMVRLQRTMAENKIVLSVKRLIANGETLFENSRQEIESTFEAPLFNTYGSTEFPSLGFECYKKKGFHLLTSAAVVEILVDGRPAKEGEEGDVFVTSLNNKCMPLLRYKLGDRAVYTSRSCGCGITYPLLERITGRVDDFLIMPDGQHLSPRCINSLEIEGIMEYKIFQEAPGRFHVLVVPSKNYSSKTEEKIKKEIRSGCQNHEIEINIELTNNLPLSRTGKLQAVVRTFS